MTPASSPTPLSPRADRVSLLHLAIGVVAAPIAWAARLIVNLAVASSTCLPEGPSPVKPAIPGAAESILISVDLAALIVAMAAAIVAYRDWRLARTERPGAHDHALEVGEDRARFLALCGIIASLGFGLATLFDLVALFIVPFCARF